VILRNICFLIKTFFLIKCFLYLNC
jgi:hypothetical protein